MARRRAARRYAPALIDVSGPAMKSRFAQILLAAVPVALAPALLFAIAEGWLNLGAGEKDILLAFPYALWALLFFVVAAVLIVRRWPLRRWFTHALLASLGVMVALVVLAFAASWLGGL